MAKAFIIFIMFAASIAVTYYLLKDIKYDLQHNVRTPKFYKTILIIDLIFTWFMCIGLTILFIRN